MTGEGSGGRGGAVGAQGIGRRVIAVSDASAAPDVVDDPATGAPSTSVPPTVSAHPNPPRSGDLTFGWRAVTAAIWIGVIIGLAAVWNASVQLGLSTWWLGPRAAPQPRVVQFSPFIAPVLMLLATINQIRWLPWFGLGAAGVVAAVGVGDIGRVSGLATVELVIAAAAALAALASSTGMYRAPPAAAAPSAAAATG